MSNQTPIKTSFWDFKTPKSYSNLVEKVLDLLLGLFVAHIPTGFFAAKYVSIVYKQLAAIEPTYSFSVSDFLPILIPLLLLVVFLIPGVFYFWRRRKYLALGLLISLIDYILLLKMILST